MTAVDTLVRRPAPPLAAAAPAWWSAPGAARRLRDLVRTVGGPLHLVHPATVARTLDEWAAVGHRHGVGLAVRFGKKANKSAAVARECARGAARGLDTGVDVASAEEFVAALAAGNRGESLVVTGPTHPVDVVWLAARHRATLTVSTVDDLRRVRRLVPDGDRLDVLLRMRTGPAQTRFGMTADSVTKLVRTPPGDDGPVRIRGVSFHCAGYAIGERVAAVREVLPLLDVARESGHPADLVSAGGGWPVDHVAAVDGLAPGRVWERYAAALEPAHFLPGRIPGGLYPYGGDLSGAGGPDAFLGAGVADGLRDRDVTLMVEPGRALVGGAGVSAFPVLSTEVRPDLGPAVGVTVVDGTSLSLSEQWFDSEFCPDPVLLDRAGTIVTGPPSVGVAVAGRTCLDSDLLSRRFVPLPRWPVEGDTLVYPDTAGYQMDSNESEFHGIPVPRKFAVVDDPDGDPTSLIQEES